LFAGTVFGPWRPSSSWSAHRSSVRAVNPTISHATSSRAPAATASAISARTTRRSAGVVSSSWSPQITWAFFLSTSSTAASASALSFRRSSRSSCLIDDALHGLRDSDRLDYGMLQTLTKSIFGRGATRLRISRGERLTIEFGEEEVSTFQQLALETPAPKVDRVVGVLDSLTMSTRTTVLKLTDGCGFRKF
jgi:hypothetical protein